jgi:hypothetical protein
VNVTLTLAVQRVDREPARELLAAKELSQFVEREMCVTPEPMAACNNDSEMKFCWPTALSRFRL